MKFSSDYDQRKIRRRIQTCLTVTLVSCVAAMFVDPLWTSVAFAHGGYETSPTEVQLKPVLADLMLLETIGVEIISRQEETHVGFALLSPTEEKRLSALAHKHGRCGGFEALPEALLAPQDLVLSQVFGQLAEQEMKNRRFQSSPRTFAFTNLQLKPEIESALREVSEDNLRQTVVLLSSFMTRYHKSTQANQAVISLKQKIEEVIKGSSFPILVEFVDHSSTRQNSLRVRITGSKRPDEVIVLGAHLDSVNQDWFGKKDAPGADDNASGSSNLVEALRVLALQSAAPERTLEFIWYAGEEGGLLGSGEIARQYKSQNKDVIAVLQLDMTLHPGDGEFTLGSMTDFTSAWLRSYLEALNSLYIKARIVEDKCGYGCSDHASWHRQGFATLMPFEASFDRANSNIHTSRDVINSASSFRHSAMFTKIALVIALDLGNSNLREKRI